MRKFTIIQLCFLIFIGLNQQGICDTPPGTKGPLAMIKARLNKWKETKKTKETEDVLKDLKKIKAVSKSAEITKVLNTTAETALAAKQIIFVTDPNNNPPMLVIKRFNGLKGFQEEQKGLDTVNETVVPKIKALQVTTCKLPTITTGQAYPKIDKVGVVVLEAGLGDTLYDRFVEKLSTVPDNEIREAFIAIGEQLGCLDKESYTKYKEILLHGDAHARNFTYDGAVKKLYWIDTSEMEFLSMAGRKQRVTGIDKLLFLFQIAGSNERNTQLDEWLKKANKYRNDAGVANIFSLPAKQKQELEDDLNNIKKARKKDELAIESFQKGYLSANREQEATCNENIKDVWGSFDAKTVSNKIEEYSAAFKCAVQHP